MPRMTPMRANIVGPPDSATGISASIAACHSAVSASFLGSLVASVAASSNVTSLRPSGSTIASSKRRLQDRLNLAPMLLASWTAPRQIAKETNDERPGCYVAQDRDTRALSIGIHF
jgi:hypothetical protein